MDEITSFKREVYSRRGWEDALEIVEEVYRGQGFLSVKLEVLEPSTTLETGVFSKEVRVITKAKIIEGPRTNWGQISYSGGNPQIMSEINLQQTGFFQPSMIDQLESSIIQAHQEQGYYNVSLIKEVQHDLEKNTISVHFTIAEKNKLKFRSVVISGNRRIKREFLDDLLAVEVGEFVTPSKLASVREKLYKLRLFKSIQVQPIGEDPENRDLLIQVSERPNMLFSVGGGAATDEGMRITTSANHINMFGLAHQLNFIGTFGFGWSGDGWRIDRAEPLWRSILRYTAPRVPSANAKLIFETLSRCENFIWAILCAQNGCAMYEPTITNLKF